MKYIPATTKGKIRVKSEEEMKDAEIEMLIDDFDNYLAEDNQGMLTDDERGLLKEFIEWRENIYGREP